MGGTGPDPESGAQKIAPAVLLASLHSQQARQCRCLVYCCFNGPLTPVVEGVRGQQLGAGGEEEDVTKKTLQNRKHGIMSMCCP